MVVSTHLENISQNGSFPLGRGESQKYLKPPPSYIIAFQSMVFFPKAKKRQTYGRTILAVKFLSGQGVRGAIRQVSSE